LAIQKLKTNDQDWGKMCSNEILPGFISFPQPKSQLTYSPDDSFTARLVGQLKTHTGIPITARQKSCFVSILDPLDERKLGKSLESRILLRNYEQRKFFLVALLLASIASFFGTGLGLSF
jgi:hypothetical protein